MVYSFMETVDIFGTVELAVLRSWDGGDTWETWQYLRNPAVLPLLFDAMDRQN